MGVDLIMRKESLALCQTARCRAFRPGNPAPALLFRIDEHRQRRVIPLENLPLSVETFDGLEFEPGQGTSEHYALDFIIKGHAVTRNTKKLIFKGWLSKDEYEKLITPAATYYTWSWLESEEQKKICNICPLKHSNDTDCEPRLFTYGTLSSLRQAFSTLFSKPPYIVETQVATLLDDFSAVFPLGKIIKDNAAEMEQRHGRIFDKLTQEGYNMVVPETAPTPFKTTTIIATTVVNKLFFRDPDEDEDYWIGGEQLALLDSWITDLLNIVALLAERQFFSEDLNIMGEIMAEYSESCKTALKYNLEIGISW